MKQKMQVRREEYEPGPSNWKYELRMRFNAPGLHGPASLQWVSEKHWFRWPHYPKIGNVQSQSITAGLEQRALVSEEQCL